MYLFCLVIGYLIGRYGQFIKFYIKSFLDEKKEENDFYGFLDKNDFKK